MPAVKNIVKRKRGRPSLGKGEATFIGVKLAEETVKSVDRWSKQNGVKRSEAIRRLIEIGLAGGSRSIPLITATGDAAAAAGHAMSSTASEMAGHQLDELGDASATAEERKTRKQRLLKGPTEFRDIRIDHPAREPARASKPPAGAKTAMRGKPRRRRS